MAADAVRRLWAGRRDQVGIDLITGLPDRRAFFAAIDSAIGPGGRPPSAPDDSWDACRGALDESWDTRRGALDESWDTRRGALDDSWDTRRGALDDSRDARRGAPDDSRD